MESFMVYLFKSSIWLIAFYAVYQLFLRKETFHTLKRLFLLAGLIAAVFMPLFTLHIGVIHTSIDAETPIATLAEAKQNADVLLSIETVLTIFYILTATFFLLRLLWGAIQIIAELGTSSTLTEHNKIIHTTMKETPFSFFSYIFLPKTLQNEDEKRLIIAHEKVHIRELHWVDTLLSQCLCVLQFFNPFSWLYLHAIQENHEFIADREIVKTKQKSYYQNLIVKYSIRGAYPLLLINHFSNKQLLKRIQMMKTQKSNPFSWIKISMVLPLAAGILFAYSQPQVVADKQDNISTKTEVKINDKAQIVHNGQVYYTIPDMLPKFPNGDVIKFLSENVKYPVEAQKKGIQGKVVCQFFVEKDGSISDIKIIRSVDPLLDNEAIRAIKLMPKWIPGKNKGETVACKYTLPINFKLKK